MCCSRVGVRGLTVEFWVDGLFSLLRGFAASYNLPLCSMIRRLLRSFSTLPLSTLGNPQTRLLLCNQRIQELSKFGRIKEARHVFESMPQRDAVSWNSMISGYTRNGLLDEAKALFDAFGGKNVRTWTILLNGYARSGRIDEALAVFESMPERNSVSWNSMISGYMQNGELRSARKLFDAMPDKNHVSWNSMITGYCQFGMMAEARLLFERMKERSSVSWMVMMSGYVETHQYGEACGVFIRMLREGVMINQGILVVAFSAITGLNNLDSVESLRAVALKVGFEGDVLVGTAILNAYTRIGSLDYAFEFFEIMPEKSEHPWTTMIAAFSRSDRLNDAIALYKRSPQKSISVQTSMIASFSREGRIDEARNLFDEILNPNVVAWNAMIAAYAQNGMIEEAKNIFLRMPSPNDVSYGAMISGLVQNGQSMEALQLFSELHRSGAFPSHSGLTSALSACANVGYLEVGRQLHSLTIKMRCKFNAFVGNGLINMYAKCKIINDAYRFFSTMEFKDTMSWNCLISGLAENHLLDFAQKTFEMMPHRDVVSWTTIISAYEQANEGDFAFVLFLKMLAQGLKPSESTLSSILTACAFFGAAKLGEQIHALVYKLGFNSCLFVCNSLITMYFKCGNINGISVFEEMVVRDIVTWNAVLLGCSSNGLGNEAIEIFEQMESAGVLPDEISFCAILHACSHIGSLDKGRNFLISMQSDYGIVPSIHHYTCMVELLGRNGQLLDAESLIKNLPVNPDLVIWKVLLTASRIHRNVEIARRVAEKLMEMDAKRSESCESFSSIYASQVQEMRKSTRTMEPAKEPEMSWMQIKNEMYCFVKGDKSRIGLEDIRVELKNLYEQFIVRGYIGDADCIHSVVEDELLDHTEKLTVVRGILIASKRLPIQIMTNHRICGDCHSFMKFTSKISARWIVVRDERRIHHFRDGSCSCGDYW